MHSTEALEDTEGDSLLEVWTEMSHLVLCQRGKEQGEALPTPSKEPSAVHPQGPGQPCGHSCRAPGGRPGQVDLWACSGCRGSQNPTIPASLTPKLTNAPLAAGLQAPGLLVMGSRECPCPVRGRTICQAGSF